MEPLYFGAEDRRLFGIYHPPLGAPRQTGVVICRPPGQEGVRAHRALRQLALRLADLGFHVLRFDPYGCGDSAGEDLDGTLAQWRRDVSTAMDELRSGTGIEIIGVLGLRLSAAVVLQACGCRDDVRALVLWDPVIDGPRHLDELDALHRRWLRGSFAREAERAGRASSREILGFALSETLVSEILELDLQLPARPSREALWLDTGEARPTAPLLARLRSLGVRVDSLHVPAPPAWVKVKDGDEFGGGLVPNDVLEAITTWLARATS
jgi:pimeloyl-ACP methyl ester carboxylesterase